MIEIKDIIIIFVGYALGFLAGFIYGMKSGSERFWRMPSASWRIRK